MSRNSEYSGSVQNDSRKHNATGYCKRVTHEENSNFFKRHVVLLNVSDFFCPHLDSLVQELRGLL